MGAGRVGELPSGYAGAVAGALVPAAFVLVPGVILTWLLVRAPAEPVTPPEGELQHYQHHRRFHL